MTIALDVDDVLVDHVPALMAWHDRVYGTRTRIEDLRSYDFGTVWNCSMEEATRRSWEFFRTQEEHDIGVIAGAREGVAQLYERDRLVVVTGRPDWLRAATEQTLERYFPGRIAEVIFTNHFDPEKRKPKGAVCRDIGASVLIEDAMAHAESCAAYGVRAVLLARPWNENFPLPAGVTRVSRWEDVVTEVLGDRP